MIFVAVTALLSAVHLPDVHIITMHNNAMRVANVQKLQRLHPTLNASIWRATTPAEIASDEMAPYINAKTKKMRTGQVGCAISHLKLLEHFIKSGKKSMIVFEDDVVVADNIESKLRIFLTHVPGNNEFSQLLHHKDMKALRRQPQFKCSDPFILKSYAPYGTVGYFVTRSGAQTILKTSKPIWQPIDEMVRGLIKTGNLKSYMPSDDLITMPYVLASTVWTTSPKGASFWNAQYSKSKCIAFRTLWTPKLWSEFEDLLKWTHAAFEKHEVEYAIVSGTALGYKRFKAFLPWDDDVDIAVRKRDLRKAEAAVLYPYCSARFYGGSTLRGMKIFKCSSPKAGSYPWRYPFIDVFQNADESNFPSQTVPFLSFNVSLPRNLESYLLAEFHDTSVCKAPWWDHKHERMRSYASDVLTEAPFNWILQNCADDLHSNYYPLLAHAHKNDREVFAMHRVNLLL